MIPVGRIIPVLCLAAVSASFSGDLHAEGTAAELRSAQLPVEAGPANLGASSKQPCATGSIWCLDDYCPKWLPCIRPPLYCGACDCYDAKPAPCLFPPTYCGQCDSYDAKCPPFLKIPCRFPDFYICPPPKCRVNPTVGAGVTEPH